MKQTMNDITERLRKKATDQLEKDIDKIQFGDLQLEGYAEVGTIRITREDLKKLADECVIGDVIDMLKTRIQAEFVDDAVSYEIDAFMESVAKQEEQAPISEPA